MPSRHILGKLPTVTSPRVQGVLKTTDTTSLSEPLHAIVKEQRNRIQRRATRLVGGSVISGQLDPLALQRDTETLYKLYRVYATGRALRNYSTLFLPMNPVIPPLSGNAIITIAMNGVLPRFISNFLPQPVLFSKAGNGPVTHLRLWVSMDGDDRLLSGVKAKALITRKCIRSKFARPQYEERFFRPRSPAPPSPRRSNSPLLPRPSQHSWEAGQLFATSPRNEWKGLQPETALDVDGELFTRPPPATYPLPPWRPARPHELIKLTSPAPPLHC
ncbi:hypothetical protein EVAR_22338_1 [Eumeta japonica]|uniref:Uncharacterized protein n=1 Tax=Eumeta variegata TaxID=151549 RepID=A0A4C1VJC9_EUMVA|nr:hypothetical protein EVAR_22338_1 [Eumeta japonica]